MTTKKNYIGCDCQTIVISLKNGALHQSSRQGIYQRAGKVNAKTSWISTSNNNALWYNADPQDWIIGPVDYLGANMGSIASTGYQGITSCPYNLPDDAWQYVNTDGSWIIADANDVSIECLTGNHSLLRPPTYTVFRLADHPAFWSTGALANHFLVESLESQCSPVRQKKRDSLLIC